MDELHVVLRPGIDETIFGGDAWDTGSEGGELTGPITNNRGVGIGYKITVSFIRRCLLNVRLVVTRYVQLWYGAVRIVKRGLAMEDIRENP